MKRPYLWGGLASLVLLAIGMIIFNLGINPLMHLAIFSMKMSGQIVSAVMTLVGLLIMVYAAQKFSDCVVGGIEKSISNASERRKDRKRRQALFATATEIPVFRPTPIEPPLAAAPVTASPVWDTTTTTDTGQVFESRRERRLSEATTMNMDLQPSTQTGGTYS